MLGETLSFLRQYLDDHLRVAAGGSVEDNQDALVAFLDGDKVETPNFKLGAVTLVLINLEEERVLRQADPYVRVNATGAPERVQPEIRLVLCLLLVARFKNYNESWDHLSRLLSLLQTERVFERSSHPGLPAGVEKLVFELSSQTFAEQGQMWGTLRTAYLPSMLYRVKLLAFRDSKPTSLPVVASPTVDLRRLS
jgi:hypothetical protein